MKNVKNFSLGIAMLLTFLNFITLSSFNSVTNTKVTITGVVSDELGPIAGVNIQIQGSKSKTSTDFDGKYKIEANENDILVFTYTGKKTQKITIKKKLIVNVFMEDEVLTGRDVEVVGAVGIKKKQEVYTSSIQVVNSEEITKAANPNVVQSLSGKVSGLTVNTTNNGVNPTTRIVLRGNRSVSNNNEALVVIDNVISDARTLQALPPEVIEYTNVLKGAQGAALYGEQGVNGAIIVLTKKGLSTEEKKKVQDTIAKCQQPIVVPNETTSQEDYDSFIENSFTNPKNEPLSTFSIDVDNASYTNVRRFINNGQAVPKNAVRVEEMVNFFKYNYEQPKSNHPFSIHTEYSDSPWNEKHKLVKIGLQGKHIDSDNLPNSNFVFLIDVSGSMSAQNKLPLLKESMKVLVSQLRENDKVAIVVYAGAAGLVLPPTSGNNKETIIKSLDNLNAGGSTAGGAGIELAYKIATENFIKGGNNRVILATDGDFNVGTSSNKDMETLIEEKRKSGVFLTCLGYGMGNYKDSKMEILADKGNGNYAYIDNIQEANRFLGKEFKGSMFAIAKDVKIQIEFNPKHVQSYRLIGYENRKLRPEDFRNDAIDAGELGSGHTVTALYEIIPVGVESKFTNEIPDLKYTETVKSTKDYSNELATIKFRYKKPDGEKSIEMVQIIENKPIALQNTSEDFKFSSAVAWFGLKLRDSKLVDNKSSVAIKALALQGKSNDAEGYRAEFIRLVEAVN
ncbi:YfbK domain-containing protein [Flavobacterium lacisediminis]|uniref:von Willebrand factor type A domain-containing protein n=1 Tax=Flavobacterium lacisediminis TaxID=2989705 RepID=A0ABT3EGN9_9FLAO|nr:von Willebrand factor type A domain-containing protein [Flavobacterium lacisediminis]MCW1147742.1 von Willebrand factor type A domain-containing protein [Flavobacterium lacisediminis]